MPFTPYHAGPPLALGLIFKKHLDIPALLVSSVILDVEPLAILLFNLDYPLHGLLHNFTIGGAVAVLVAAAMYLMRGSIREIMAVFKLEQDSSFKVLLISSFVGLYSHVAIDAFLYSVMKPFYPFGLNLLKTNWTRASVECFGLICYGVAVAVYFFRLYRSRKRGREERKK